MKGFIFSKFYEQNNKAPFERLLDLFKELLLYTNGDAAEALNWMNDLDREHHITNGEYGMGDFIEDLKAQGYLKEDDENGGISITPKTEQSIRQNALDQIFGKLKKSKQGNHKTNITGVGDEISADMREYRFGDTLVLWLPCLLFFNLPKI